MEERLSPADSSAFLASPTFAVWNAREMRVNLRISRAFPEVMLNE